MRYTGLAAASAVLVLLLMAGISRTSVAQSCSSSGLAKSGSQCHEDLTMKDKPVGLYLYVAHPDLANFDAAYATALRKPYIDGAAIVVQWSLIEPGAGVYDWTVLDRWVGHALALKKRISVGIIAGLYAPQWLYGVGFDVPRNEFYYNRSSASTACIVMTQPSFWNPTYLREYGKLLLALSSHLKSINASEDPSSSAYDAVSVVKLSGINNTTDELRIDTTQSDEGPCHQSDASSIWAAAGLRSQNAVAAFRTIVQATKEAFPDKLWSVPIIHRKAFPQIDNDGHVDAVEQIPDLVTGLIIRTVVRLYRPNVMVQWDALWQGRPPEEVIAAFKGGTAIGWQMNGFLGAWMGSGCIYPGWNITPCHNVADFASILHNGLNLGGRYIEVQMGNVIDGTMDDAFEAVHNRLWR
jgi:hypothetical protein